MSKVELLVFTDGRAGLLYETIRSAEEKLDWEFSRKTIINDNQSPEFRLSLDETYPEYRIIHNDPKRGFGGSIQVGWTSVDDDTDYIFHLEEDFTFNRCVPIADMIAVIEENPHLVQLVLKRQPGYTHEHEAGGIVELYPDSYEEFSNEHGTWTEHRRFYSTNPSLVPRRTFENGWPNGDISELTFSNWMTGFEHTRFAFWGAKFEEPWVTHTGIERHPESTGY